MRAPAGVVKRPRRELPGASLIAFPGILYIGPLDSPDTARYVAALARAVAMLRRSSEPDQPQKDALRALVAVSAERSATLRFYGGEVTLDGLTLPTTDPRLAAFAERLVAQNVAEITIAKGALPDELLALVMGLASDAGQGRIKERLRDAGSARVMVVLHQYDHPEGRSVSAAFAKVKLDQAVLAEWNKFIEHGAQAESQRAASALPEGLPPDVIEWEMPPQEVEAPPPPRPPRPSVLQEGATPNVWFASFEQGLKAKFEDQFGGTDWGYRFDRAAGALSAGDPQGRSSISVSLPQGYLEQSAWLLAGKLLADLRQLAEREGGLRRRR